MVGETGQTCGHEAATCANLQHFLVAVKAQSLQQAAFNGRRHHVFTVPDRQCHIGECQGFETLADEAFPRQFPEHCENFLIIDIPASYLLVDHLQARVLRVHACVTCNLMKLKNFILVPLFTHDRESVSYDSQFGIMVNRRSVHSLLGYAYPKMRLEP